MKTLSLPLGFGEVDFGDWFRGLAAAFIGGGAGAFGAGVANVMNHPGTTIWRTEFWSTVSTVFVIAGLINMFAFLRTKPIPDMKQVEKIVQTITAATSETPKVIETIKETHVEPLEPKESLQKPPVKET
jgi:hypothetical protein